MTNIQHVLNITKTTQLIEKFFFREVRDQNYIINDMRNYDKVSTCTYSLSYFMDYKVLKRLTSLQINIDFF